MPSRARATTISSVVRGNDLLYGGVGNDVLYGDTGKAQGRYSTDDVLGDREGNDELHAHPVFAVLV